jgi:hypothetical protein
MVMDTLDIRVPILAMHATWGLARHFAPFNPLYY